MPYPTTVEELDIQIKGHRGRGKVAVKDMKNRLAAMGDAGLDLSEQIDILWERNARAVSGPGFVYDMAEGN